MARHAKVQTFYASKEWVSFRLGLIAERGNRCERCKQIISRPIDVIGHHKIELTPENVKDVIISLNPELVELICFDCHQKEHNRFGYQTEKKVYIVYGPPLSGKTSFVQSQMRRGDIVIDMDRLYEAITMLPAFDKPDNLLGNVRGIYNLLLDNIKTRYGKWNNAWIIGTYPDKYKREKLAEDLGAELIFCEVSKDECLRRLSLDEDRKYRQDEWCGYVNKWFEHYIA
ncbi:MAG: hypothetical protein AWM53_01989 [Candidatus Dichloromethanomonas elyunquensis]|nr:MAG: hypothetical protein AWM53_01989 [Candidatus Dichloromethanomonas elyunquensis]